MKYSRLWARALGVVVVLATGIGVSAAQPAGAKDWVDWSTMHASSFEGSNESAVAQCFDSVGLITGLENKHCETLERKLSRGQCAMTMVKDGERYSGMRGRVGGDPKGSSRLTPHMIKRTGRPDRALRCDLNDGIVVDWFTGHWIDGKYVSCNNLGFVYFSLTTSVKECHEAPISRPIVDDTGLQLNSLYVESCCCRDLYIPGLNYQSEGTLKMPPQKQIICE